MRFFAIYLMHFIGALFMKKAGLFIGLSAAAAVTFLGACARPPTIEIILRFGGEIDLPAKRAQIIERLGKVHDIAVLGIDVEQVRLMRSGGAVADSLASTSAKFDALAQDNRQDVRIFAREGLPELEQLLREGRGAALELRELSRELRDNPSRLLYQTKPQGLEIPP